MWGSTEVTGAMWEHRCPRAALHLIGWPLIGDKGEPIRKRSGVGEVEWIGHWFGSVLNYFRCLQQWQRMLLLPTTPSMPTHSTPLLCTQSVVEQIMYSLVNHGPSQQSSKIRIQAMEMRSYQKIVHIFRTKTMLPIRKSMPRSSRELSRPHNDLLTIIKRCKLPWRDVNNRHTSRSSGFGQNHFGKHHERVKEIPRATKEEAWRQHRVRDNPKVRQIPRGQRRTRQNGGKNGWKVICGAPMLFVVKWLMMMTINSRHISDISYLYTIGNTLPNGSCGSHTEEKISTHSGASLANIP